MQDCVWAVVERLKGWNQAAPTDPDKGGGEQLGWQLAGQIGARIVAKPSARESSSGNPKSRGEEKDSVCFERGARMDSYAAVLTTDHCVQGL